MGKGWQRGWEIVIIFTKRCCEKVIVEREEMPQDVLPVVPGARSSL